MSEVITKTLLLNGYFPNDTFPDWIIGRATLLSLSGWVRADGEHLVEIFVSGDPILIDAMEVACSLGPIDAQVDSIDERQEKTPEMDYRQSAQFVRY